MLEVKKGIFKVYLYYMIIVTVKNKSIEQALKQYKSKVIKTRQMSELNKKKNFCKTFSVKKSRVTESQICTEKF